MAYKKIVRRDAYLDQLVQRMNNGMVKVVTGLRRSGKSFLLFRIFKNYLLAHKVKAPQIIEIALDNDKQAELRNPIVLGEFLRKKIKGRSKYYVLIDEIQYCRDVENPALPGDRITFYNVLNGLLQKDNVDVYVTGSNSKMLSSDILTEFRGRGDQIHVRPLCFREYFDAVKGDFDDAWQNYVTYGGLPKVALMKTDSEKSAYLKNLVDEVYLKDIVQRNNIENEEALASLVNVLSSATGSFTNPTKIENTFKSELGVTYTSKTIFAHLQMLKDAFFLSEAMRYNVKGRKYIGANSKYYFADVGLRNARLNFRQLEATHLMENVIYNELLVRGFNVDVGIVEVNAKQNGKNVKLQLEVDFVATLGNKKLYVQSAYRMDDTEKQNQEMASLRKIDDSFAKIIIVRDNVKPHQNEDGFMIMGLRNFLLQE